MFNPDDFFVWVQTTPRRDARPTLDSIEASDIGRGYVQVHDKPLRTFPDEYPALQQWWSETTLEMATAAYAAGKPWILRLEDDIIINRHILHNLSMWSALRDPLFGLGTLFCPDYWLRCPQDFEQSSTTKEWYRKSKDVEGAQAQVYRVETIQRLIPLVQSAREARGLGKPHHPPTFDWGLSRAAHIHGCQTPPRGTPLKVFVHRPSLVNLRDISRWSALNLHPNPHSVSAHYWAHQTFKEDWKRPDEWLICRNEDFTTCQLTRRSAVPKLFEDVPIIEEVLDETLTYDEAKARFEKLMEDRGRRRNPRRRRRPGAGT